MKFERYFSASVPIAYDAFKWKSRIAKIVDSSGKSIFEQKDVLFPDFWSDSAVNITSSKYFYGNEGEESREYSLKQIIDRVVGRISEWGQKDGYFSSDEDRVNFEEELKYLVVSQRFSFNSPVWFNIGTKNEQVSSACYINSLEDSMDSILDLVTREGNIFKAGSGSGINVSTLRGKDEPIGDNGKSSGPLSFMRLFNSTAQVVKSGGKSRRAATIRSMNIDHPDIEEFIWCKAKEEKKAKSLISNGFDIFDAYESISFQNANHSVRLTDYFMNAVLKDEYFDTKYIKSGKVSKRYKAKNIFRQIAEAAYECGDPGLQFDTVVNEYNTCKKSGRINASNPCIPFNSLVIKQYGNSSELERFGSIRVGDYIWSTEGWTKVVNKWSNGVKDVYEYKTEFGNFYSTKDHLIPINNKKIEISKSDKIEYMEVDNVGLSSVDLRTVRLTLEEIISSKLHSSEEVFDITVDNNSHTFWCNGFNVSNCSEYVFLDDTACTLGSINLLKYVDSRGFLDKESFKRTVDLAITALDILVGNSTYPVEKISNTNIKYRTVGLGYSNLGTVIMKSGKAFDSDDGRNIAQTITSLLTAYSFKRSSEISRDIRPFDKYEENKESVIDVVKKYKYNAKKYCPETLMEWDEVVKSVEEFGLRNAEVTCEAPTGTIGIMMGCQTSGIEPELALVKYKTLMDGSGGVMKFVNPFIEDSLKNLGYKQKQISNIIKHVEDNGTIEGSEIIPEHLSIFDCSLKPEKGFRTISPIGHVKMMEVIQRFISMSISKTCNLPETATIEDIENIYMEAWKRGLKGITIYRDNCKGIQPLEISKEKKKPGRKPSRKKLPDTRNSITHKFELGGYEGYITAGLYPDGSPGELFLVMNKVGSIVSGMMDALGTSISLSLQYGVPLDTLVSKLINSRYEPSGITQNKQIRFAKSITDYIARWLSLNFLTEDKCRELGVLNGNTLKKEFDVVNSLDTSHEDIEDTEKRSNSGDVIVCPSCGEFAFRKGSCHSCDNCGWTAGCSG